MKNFVRSALSVFVFAALAIVAPISWADAGVVISGRTSTHSIVPVLVDSAGKLAATASAGVIFTPAAPTVTNAATLLSAADTDQKYWQVQNNHATATIHVSSSATVTIGTGVKLGPGQAWAPLVAPTGAMYAIGDIASNTAVVLITGK